MKIFAAARAHGLPLLASSEARECKLKKSRTFNSSVQNAL